MGYGIAFIIALLFYANTKNAWLSAIVGVVVGSALYTVLKPLMDGLRTLLKKALVHFVPDPELKILETPQGEKDQGMRLLLITGEKEESSVKAACDTLREKAIESLKNENQYFKVRYEAALHQQVPVGVMYANCPSALQRMKAEMMWTEEQVIVSFLANNRENNVFRKEITYRTPASSRKGTGKLILLIDSKLKNFVPAAEVAEVEAGTAILVSKSKSCDAADLTPENSVSLESECGVIVIRKKAYMGSICDFYLKMNDGPVSSLKNGDECRLKTDKSINRLDITFDNSNICSEAVPKTIVGSGIIFSAESGGKVTVTAMLKTRKGKASVIIESDSVIGNLKENRFH